VTITGTNDDPVITDGPDSVALGETDAGLSTTGTLTVTDVDTTDVVTASIDALTVGGTSDRLDPAAPSDVDLLAMFTIDTAPILDGTQTTNTLTWTFDSGAEAFDYLATGETLVLTYTIKVTDDDGTPLSDTETVTITITGMNDKPQVAAPLGDVTVHEDAEPTTIDNIGATFSDVDTPASDKLSLTVSSTSPNVVTATLDNGSLILTYGADKFGGTTVTLRATDTEGSWVETKFDVTVTAVGDTPLVESITAYANQMSGLIVIQPNVSDGNEVQHFLITGIEKGTLFYADGTTEIVIDPDINGAYITRAEGLAGVRFMPEAKSNADGKFVVYSSENGTEPAKQSGGAVSNIQVRPATEGNSDPGDNGDTTEDTGDNDAGDVVLGVPDSSEREETAPDGGITAEPSTPRKPVSFGFQMDSTLTLAKKPVIEALSDRPFWKMQAASASAERAGVRPLHVAETVYMEAYELLQNSLDAIKRETLGNMELHNTVVGSAIAATTTLSVGYVVWLIRGGMLLSGLLSSMPAWQLADPLPILARMKSKDDEDDEDSLEGIIEQGSRGDSGQDAGEEAQ
ncbi:MAG: VCBS domain-containing protein, partial [bacterium]|nr:VCBS domain-containing protein [bacterium]